MFTYHLCATGHPRIEVPTMDEELDRYRLLAFLQRIDEHYRANKLYPLLDELSALLQRIQLLRTEVHALEAALPRSIMGADLEAGTWLHAPLDRSGPFHQALALAERALPELNARYDEGVALRDAIYARIHPVRVGVMPLFQREGYLLVRQERQASIYRYTLPLVQPAGLSYGHRSLRTMYVSTVTMGAATTYEAVKAGLLRSHPDLPNPPLFVVEGEEGLPRMETLVPLAKHLVYRSIAPADVGEGAGAPGQAP